MGVRYYSIPQVSSAEQAAIRGRAIYHCDTEAERPSSGFNIGDEAFCVDTNKTYRCTAINTWSLSDVQNEDVRLVASAQFNYIGNVLRCPCHVGTTQIAASDRAYWCYIGYRPSGEIIRFVRAYVPAANLGIGSQAAEVAVCTSTTPPTGSNITLTKLWANGTLDDMTVGGGRKGNTVANTVAIASDAHVWVGIRVSMSITQPTFHTLTRDNGDGFLAQTASAGTLTSGSSWTAVPVTFANLTSVDIRGYL